MIYYIFNFIHLFYMYLKYIGASGYIGREIIHTLLEEYNKQNEKSVKNNNDVLQLCCLVRQSKVSNEEKYWKEQQKHSNNNVHLKVYPYNMLDNGDTLLSCLNDIDINNNDDDDNNNICIYHTASIFGPTKNPIETANENIKGTETIFHTISKYSKDTAANNNDNMHVIVTSSMAAVRGGDQIPKNKNWYTYHDWNTASKLDDNNWGSCYQYSKAKSELRAWELSKEYNIPLTTLCPSFVFGPVRNNDESSSSSYAVKLIKSWMKGASSVQSRLCVDVRDVALAHVIASKNPKSCVGKRLLLSTEARAHGKDIADCMKEAILEHRDDDKNYNVNDIHYDKDYKGGAIPIGEKEVECLDRLKEVLNFELRYSVLKTIRDMVPSLL